MSKVVFYTATSLNGYIADEANSLEWLFAVEAPDWQQYEEFFDAVGAMVEGSTTYEWVLNFEGLLEQPEKWKELYGSRRTFVFTSRDLPKPDGADVQFVSGGVADAFPAIAEAAGDKDIWVVGGGDLAGQFLDAGLLTELQISVAPVALTGGAPLLPRRIESDRLKLRSVEKMGQFAHMTYDVVPPAGPHPAPGTATATATAMAMATAEA
ncbi:dihydrofolate reductase family protein [Arthrobacter sp. H14]|uniref:dihydrofolate reductase family protein n=1 Tax=Arthrobacter sp. H14 TaxID=1312959 RepID=UPI0004AE9322|nr:dihydrofolate reductase family protein [Arthrobacter sp. H14]